MPVFALNTPPAKLRLNYYGLIHEMAVRQTFLRQLLSHLEKQNISAILLRGDALAEFYYPNPAIRTCTDADLLIHSDHLPLFRTFCQVKKIRDFGDDNTVYFYPEESASAVILDLHTELWYLRDQKSVWEHSRLKDFLGESCRILSAEDLVLHLVAHSMAHHGRFSGEDALDLARVLQKEKNVDWSMVQKKINGTSLGIFLFKALSDLRDTRKVAIPDALLNRFKPRGLKRLEAKFYGAILAKKSQSFAVYLLKPSTFPGWKRKLQFWRSLLFPSPDFIRRRYGLKWDWQVALFRLFRPFHLAAYALLFLPHLFLKKT